jgi:hypothetical protein
MHLQDSLYLEERDLFEDLEEDTEDSRKRSLFEDLEEVTEDSRKRSLSRPR